ncbi:hypothetical protein [Acinetobacter junii]|nr:hypothetical protein [Acinetobacter junii]
MKKRNKKYNPNKLAQKYVADAHKMHTLEMTFNIDEVNDSIDSWRASNGLVEKEHTPKHVVYEVYHGDLIICLKNLLIPLEQEWFLGVDSHYFNYETEEVLTVPFQFQMPLMSFEEFRFGSELIKVDRGHGVKTRWKGINEELNKLLEEEVPQGFERIRSDALLRVITKFNNVTDYLYFKEAKMARELLGVAA